MCRPVRHRTKLPHGFATRSKSGELTAGDRVPSTREIMRRWGVAMATASKVLSILKDEGLVHTRPGAGHSGR